MGKPFLSTSAVEQVEHVGEGELGSGPVAILNDTLPNEAVVRATGQIDQLKDVAVISEPLDDVLVVGAGSTFGELLVLVHGYIITRFPGIASPPIGFRAGFWRA